MTFVTMTEEETIALGERIGSRLRPGDVIALRGGLAAGKTTLTKGIARALKIDEDVTSPTFTIVSEYDGSLPLYHMDAYRLDSPVAFMDLGVEDCLYGEGVCVIEWSERVMSELPRTSIIISLEAREDGSRSITLDNWPYGEIEE